MIEQLRHHDVAALIRCGWRLAGTRRRFVEELRDPRAGHVHDAARFDHLHADRLRVPRWRAMHRRRPAVATTLARVSTRCAALPGIHRVRHHEAGIVDPAVGELEARAIPALERRARRMLSQVDGFRCGQAAALGEVVVQKKARANHPCRAQVIDRAATRTAAATPGAARKRARFRVRAAICAPARSRNARGNAGRHGSAWCWPTKCATRDRAVRRARPAGRAPLRRARCRCR